MIIIKDTPIGGTLYTIEMAEKHKKPYLVFNISTHSDIREIVNWIIKNNIHKLNVAGPRASKTANIYNFVYVVLQQLLNHQLLNQNNDALADKGLLNLDSKTTGYTDSICS